MNKPGGNANEMLAFNVAINALDIVEIPLIGRKYIWSNMQEDPLLQKLDWVFTSANWVFEFPGTTLKDLTRNTSDYVPCLATINTTIPKPKVFRFENYWMEHRGFLAKVEEGWNIAAVYGDIAKRITTKLKKI